MILNETFSRKLKHQTPVCVVITKLMPILISMDNCCSTIFLIDTVILVTNSFSKWLSWTLKLKIWCQRRFSKDNLDQESRTPKCQRRYARFEWKFHRRNPWKRLTTTKMSTNKTIRWFILGGLQEEKSLAIGGNKQDNSKRCQRRFAPKKGWSS